MANILTLTLGNSDGHKQRYSVMVEESVYESIKLSRATIREAIKESISHTSIKTLMNGDADLSIVIDNEFLLKPIMFNLRVEKIGSDLLVIRR